MNTTIYNALQLTSNRGSLPYNPEKKDPVIGSVATQAIDFVSNTSACTRTLGACVIPGPQPAALSALGATTPFGVFQASIACKNAAGSYCAAADMHDEAGMTISGSDAASRAAQVIAAAFYIPIRFLDIANRGFNSLTSASYLLPYLSAVGDFCFGILFFFVGILGLRSCLETRDFIAKLDSALESQNFEEIKALIGEVTGHAGALGNKEISERDLHVHLGQQLRALLDEIDPELAAKAWDSDLGEKLFQDEKYNNLLPAVLSRMGIVTNNLTSDSLKTNGDVARMVWAKEQKARYDRILGSKGSDLAGRAKEMRLYELISNEHTKAKEKEVAARLLGRLRTCAKDQRFRMIVYTISGFAGALFTILSYTMSPAYAVFYSAGTLASYIGVAIGDTIGLKRAFASDGPVGSRSKQYLMFNLAIGVIALATASALTAMTGGVFPVAAIVIIGLVWIIMDLYALYLAYEKEKAYRAEHPTLEMFLEQIQKNGSLNIPLEKMEEDHPLKMFHKLPKVQREAVLKSVYDCLKSVVPEFINELHTLSSHPHQDEASEGKRLYDELFCHNKTLSRRALQQANKVLPELDDELTEKNLDEHQSRNLFYKAFYSEVVKRDQRKLFKKAGNTYIKEAVEKVIQDRLKTLNYFQEAEPAQSKTEVKQVKIPFAKLTEENLKAHEKHLQRPQS